jgi:hypothetical protein
MDVLSLQLRALMLRCACIGVESADGGFLGVDRRKERRGVGGQDLGHSREKGEEQN